LLKQPWTIITQWLLPVNHLFNISFASFANNFFAVVFSLVLGGVEVSGEGRPHGEVYLSICALSYSTIYYILRKYAGKENAISSLRDLTDYVSILPVDAEVIRKALYSEFSDYEDAIQHYAALQDASVEGIITRNIKDYRYSDIPVLLPTEFHK